MFRLREGFGFELTGMFLVRGYRGSGLLLSSLPFLFVYTEPRVHDEAHYHTKCVELHVYFYEAKLHFTIWFSVRNCCAGAVIA